LMWIGEIEIDELEDKWVALIMKCSIDDGTRARPILQHSRNCCRILVLHNGILLLPRHLPAECVSLSVAYQKLIQKFIQN